jgi:tripartite-type tricarboxylate transporter receptor subunit TctC
MKRIWIGLLALALGVVGASGSFADTWPSRGIRIIIGFAPGGPTDILARTVADQLTAALPQPAVVENRPGAAGNLAAELVVKAPPDGYTLFVGGMGPFAVNGALYGGRLGYDPDRDFIPLTVVGRSPMMLAVTPTLPIHSVKELVAYAKANRGKMNHASPGVGTSGHLADELFRSLVGFESTNVPYKSSPQVLTAISQGETQWGFDVPLTMVPMHRGGKIRVIAIATAERSPLYPDIPTVAEQGFPDAPVYAWFAAAAPAGTPKAIVDKLSETITTSLRTDAVRQRLASIGMEAAPMTSAEATRYFKEERERWTKVIRANNIRAE